MSIIMSLLMDTMPCHVCLMSNEKASQVLTMAAKRSVIVEEAVGKDTIDI